MKMRTAVAATIAALAFPAYSADAPKAPRPPEPPESGFSFDLGDILADAEGAKRQAEAAREHAQHLTQWAEDFAAEMQGSMAVFFSDRVGRFNEIL